MEDVIDRASVGDLRAIMEIERLSFGEDAFSERQMTYLLRKSQGAFFVVRGAGGGVLAYICLLTRRNAAYLRIYSIAVHPSARGRNLAGLLLDKAAGFAAEHGLRRVTLEVNPSNGAALSLYAKKGFVKTGLIRDYYHDGSEAWTMAKQID